MAVNNKLLVKFAGYIEKIFSLKLDVYGFKHKYSKFGDDIVDILFVREDIYVLVNAVVNEREFKDSWNIVLGVGSAKKPDSEGNAVALWFFRKELQPDWIPDVFLLRNSLSLEKNVSKGWDDLEKYGISFLKGDLILYKKLLEK